jgi:hypothetical protein
VLLPEDDVLLGPVQCSPGTDAPLQGAANTDAELGMATPDLVQFDDFIGIRVGAGSLDIDNGGNQFRCVVGRVVFSLRGQPADNPIVPTLDKPPCHFFQRTVHAVQNGEH